ncbi:MAG: hypothetical protein CUN49_07215 [Candidatus Thermofonsia Clade 1 bacterium]|uniref:Uncharacterized protein n=1 Tax=Candidatus Thermofonsia Clade 1 bacterium TaxID=2364210 RepID=A0A2M8PEX7_9CHLR|nr:MAG: hypothetical protein CUN49_07215 [Candidatus Thermofonsia Clade 1 bacterium]
MNVLVLAALHGLMALLWLFAALSRKLGAVTKQRPLYRLLYMSMALLIFGAFGQLSAPTRLLADVLSLLALLIALFVVWRYWNWLLYE